MAIVDKLEVISDMRINVKSLEDPTNNKNKTLENVQARIRPPIDDKSTTFKDGTFTSKVIIANQIKKHIPEGENSRLLKDQENERKQKQDQIEKMFKIMYKKEGIDKERKDDLDRENREGNTQIYKKRKYFENLLVNNDLKTVFKAFTRNYEKYKELIEQKMIESNKDEIWNGYFT